MAYHLTEKLLAKSKNPLVKEFVKNNYVYGETSSESSIDLRNDLSRNLRVHGSMIVTENGDIAYDQSYAILYPGDINPGTPSHHKKNLVSAGDDRLSEDDFDKVLVGTFPGNINNIPRAQLLKKYYTQGVLFYAVAPLNQLLQDRNCDYSISETMPGVAPSKKEVHYFNISEDCRDTYLEIKIAHYYLVDNKVQTIQVPGSKWKFKLTENGFKFVEAEIEDKIIFDMFLGYAEPSLAELPHYPLQARIRDTFHNIYNHNSKNRTDLSAFLGMPDNDKTYVLIYNQMESYPLGLILGLPKNILKLLTEFLPSALEVSGHYLIDSLIDIKSNALKSLLTIALMIAMAPAVILNVMGTCFTSPVRAFKNAYRFGSDFHPVMGGFFAAVSATISILLFTAAASGASTALAAVGVPAVAAAATWIATNTAIGGLISTACNTLITGTVLGLSLATTTVSLSASTVAVVAGSFIAATVFAATLVVRDRFKALLQWGNNVTNALAKTKKEEETTLLVDSTEVETATETSTARTAAALGIDANRLETSILVDDNGIITVNINDKNDNLLNANPEGYESDNIDKYEETIESPFAENREHFNI